MGSKLPAKPLDGRMWTRLCVAAAMLLAVAACAWPAAARATTGHRPSVALYYGAHPPLDALQSFDWVVVDGDARLPPPVSGIGPGHAGPTWFAYLSAGEVDDAAGDADHLPASCVIGRNRAWHSRILDLRQATCRQWLMVHRVDPLLSRGFSHFFLDTLDSHRRTLAGAAARQAYDTGIIDLVKAIRARAPHARFILNRGFNLVGRLREDGLVGVAAESMYRGWDQSAQRYTHVSNAQSDWLRQRLDAVARAGLVPIAIDYVPPGDRAEARRVAARIHADGFVPYVTNATLDGVGVGSVDPQPRQVLMLYDNADSPMATSVNWYVAMVLNHLGYATRAIDIDRQPLPTHPLEGRVAGIVTWFARDRVQHASRVYGWLRRQMQAGIPVAILGRFGFPDDNVHLAPLGLKAGPEPSAGARPAHVLAKDDRLVGFEAKVRPSLDGFQSLQLVKGHAALTVGRDGQTETAVAITPWGGYALSPYVIDDLPQGTLPRDQQQQQWILDPFAFLRSALRLPRQPAFDTTTASGNRLLFAHFDGDGFASGSYVPAYREQPAAKVILDSILKRFRIPTAASVIASEFVKGGLYSAERRARYIPIARQIFALPWVEIGSHTYSHPFDWRALENDPSLSAGLHLDPDKARTSTDAYVAVAGLKYGYNLPVPGYRFDAHQEIVGSADIINTLLAPKGKHTTLMQWSGDTDPGASVLAMSYRAGLLNINGTNSTIDAQWPSLTNVAPLGVWKGDDFQVFAPDANEDQFTDDWKPPYCGLRKVLQTYRMTESPRRLAPINIYYHFYSGARPCALKSLESIYRWAIAQPVTPVFPSHYARIALGFEYAAVARQGDAYVLGGYGADQTVRLPASAGYPDLRRSRNIAGFNDVNGARYVTLGPGGAARLVLRATPPREPYLVAANAPVSGLHRAPGHLRLDLEGHVPLKISLGHARGCRLRFDAKPVKAVAHGRTLALNLHDKHGRLSVECTP